MSCCTGFPMLPGLHDASYAANSGPQNCVLLRCRPLLKNAILQQLIETYNCNHDNHVFRVADMGCSSGPNCLANMQFMLELISTHKNSICSTDADINDPPPLELQAFFCDLPSNDFNTLIQLHDAEYNRFSTAAPVRPATQSVIYDHHGGNTTSTHKYSSTFSAAVPGTVYGRLFPRASLDLVFSSCCLHWLSQVPTIVSDPTSNEWNKGKIWVDGPRANEATGRAYAQQWQKDLETFLMCRTEEIVSGGLIFLIIPCRRDSFPPHQQQEDSSLRCLEVAWQQLVHEGVIDQSELDTFNIPIYQPTPIEIISVVKLVPTLRVEKVEVIEEPIGDKCWKQWSKDSSDFAMRQSRFYKSGFWNLIEGHVGIHKCKAIFERLQGLIKMGLENLTSWDSCWASPCSSFAVVQIFKEF